MADNTYEFFCSRCEYRVSIRGYIAPGTDTLPRCPKCGELISLTVVESAEQTINDEYKVISEYESTEQAADDSLTIATLCDMLQLPERTNDALIRAVRELMISRAACNDPEHKPEYVDDGFGSRCYRWCADCGSEVYVVRPGDIRCPECEG